MLPLFLCFYILTLTVLQLLVDTQPAHSGREHLVSGLSPTHPVDL